MENQYKASYTYSFYRVNLFEDYVHTEELSFPYDDETASRKDNISISKVSTGNEYDIYDIVFDEKRKINGYFSIIEDGFTPDYKEISSVYIPHRFRAYHYRRDGYILFDVSYKVADIFLKEINGFANSKVKNPCVSLEKYIILLDQVLSKWSVEGIWLKFNNKLNLRSTGLFGENVNESPNVKILKNEGGKTNSVIIKYIFKEFSYTLTVSSNSSISIRNSIIKDDSLLLARTLVDEILNSIK